MKSKARGSERVKSKGRHPLGKDLPSDREVKDFIVGAIEASLSKTLEQLGFSKREVNDLLEGSTKALMTAVREKLSGRSGPQGSA